ncbi:MAG: hypothetical protein ACOZAJ_02390 [Patescibacteria group bacterium]
MINSDIVFVPGAWTIGKHYGPWPTVDIWLKEVATKLTNQPKVIIAYSLGASWALSHIKFDNNTKFILINPLLDKKPLPKLFINWLKFLKQENIKDSILTNPTNWLHGFSLVIDLAKINLWPYLLKIPKENLVIIKGDKDNFFCDQAGFNKAFKYNLKTQIVSAGHNWNHNIVQTVESQLTLLLN